MRIAVMTVKGGLDDRVSYHFGRAPTITIVEYNGDTKLIKIIPNPHSGQGGGFWPVLEALKRESVEAVITGNIGPGALRNLTQAGIRVYKAPGKKVAESIQALMRGELEEIEEVRGEHGCEGHEH